MKEWEKISTEVVFSKYGRQVERRDFKMPDGTVADFYVSKTRTPACIVALTENQEVVLVRQFRPGPEAILLELPGGYTEDGENPELAIARELLEETGYSGNVQFVTRCLDDAYSTTDRYCFVATNCKLVAEQKLDSREFIEVCTVSLEDFRQLARSGRMSDIEGAYLGLDFLNLL
jgi:ADP-ribose pyrophosphatase